MEESIASLFTYLCNGPMPKKGNFSVSFPSGIYEDNVSDTENWPRQDFWMSGQIIIILIFEKVLSL